MAIDLSGSHLSNLGALVTYNGVTLPFTSMEIVGTNKYEGARHLYTTYRIRLSGIETRDRISEGRYSFNELKRKLLQRGKEFLKQDRDGSGYVQTLRVVPGTLANARAYISNTVSDGNRSVLVDVFNGPNPVSFEISRFFGESYSYVWLLDVTTFGTDLTEGFLQSDSGGFGLTGVAGLLANVVYGIDADHLVTRKITGIFFIGPRGAFLPPGETSDLATRDVDIAVRKLIATAGPDSNHSQLFASIVYLPNGFQRVGQTWNYDESLTQLRFELVDVERYRVPMRNMTTSEVKYKVKYEGVALGAPLRTSLSGYVASAKDVAREEVMARVLELGNLMMGSADTFGRYVDSFEYEVDLYHNAISFSMTGYINYGALVATLNTEVILGALGLGNQLAYDLDALSDNGAAYRPTLWGTGALVGSAYAATIATEIAKPSRLENIFARPTYSAFLPGSQPNTFGVDAHTVFLDPGEVKVVLNRNESFVVARDQAVDGTPQSPIVIRNQSALGIAFVGATAWVRQDGAVPAPELLPKACIDQLKPYGQFRIERTIRENVQSPGVVATPNANSQTVYREFKVWVFYPNAEKYANYFKSNGNDLNSVEYNVNQSLSGIQPGLEGFKNWIIANFK